MCVLQQPSEPFVDSPETIEKVEEGQIRSGQILKSLVQLYKTNMDDNETTHKVKLFSCFQGPHGFSGPKVSLNNQEV